MNISIFTGNLGSDAELKTVGGKKVCNFSVAVSCGRKSDETKWKRCELWGDRAEKLTPYLLKGKKVCVNADEVQESWTKDGKTQTADKFYVTNIELLGAKEES